MLHAERKTEGVVLAMLLQVLIARLLIVKLQITQSNQARIEPADVLCLYQGENVVNGFKYGFKQGWGYYTHTGSWKHNQICQNI